MDIYTKPQMIYIISDSEASLNSINSVNRCILRYSAVCLFTDEPTKAFLDRLNLQSSGYIIITAFDYAFFQQTARLKLVQSRCF